jgi:hypothetical protein
MLQQPIPNGTPFQSIVSKFLKIRSELATLDVTLDEQELIGALLNVLPMPDFSTERNNLLMFPKETFDMAVAICRKTSFLTKVTIYLRSWYLGLLFPCTSTRLASVLYTFNTPELPDSFRDCRSHSRSHLQGS